MEKEVGQRNRDEKQERRLDYSREYAGLADGQGRTDAACRVAHREHDAEFRATEAGFDRQTRQRRARRNDHRAPPRYAGTVGERGAQIRCDRPLGWHY